MSAELLRAAAVLMRERAAEASYGDGAWCSAYLASAIRNMQRNCDWDCPEHEDCAQPTRYAGGHIASWHPAVALAVADWLDRVAYLLDHGSTSPDEPRSALAVARAYLGSDA